MATTTGAAYPSAYAATDAGFKRYYDAVQQNFADKGMYDSTTKRQPLLDVADAYASKLATEQRTDTQNAFTNAMNLWELITSGQLSKASLTGSRTVNLPSQPGVFADIFNYKIPQYSSTGPTGDADTANTTPYIHKQYGDVIPSYDEQITTLDYKNAQTDAANAAKSLALQQAYLKLAQAQDARAAAATAEVDTGGAKSSTGHATWADVSEYALSLLASGLTPEQAIRAATTKYELQSALPRWLSTGNAEAVNFVKSIFGDDATASAFISSYAIPYGNTLNNIPGVGSGVGYSPSASALDALPSTSNTAAQPGYAYNWRAAQEMYK